MRKTLLHQCSHQSVGACWWPAVQSAPSDENRIVGGGQQRQAREFEVEREGTGVNHFVIVKLAIHGKFIFNSRFNGHDAGERIFIEQDPIHRAQPVDGTAGIGFRRVRGNSRFTNNQPVSVPSQEYQTERPKLSWLCRGSPGSRVAVRLLPFVVTNVPARCTRFVKLSLGGRG